MDESRLSKDIVGKKGIFSILLVLKIIFDIGVQVLLVYLMGELISQTAEMNEVIIIFLMMFIFYSLKGVFHYFFIKISHEKAYESLTRLRLGIINRLKQLSLGFFKKHHSGELVNIIEHDVEQVEVYLAHGLAEVMSSIFIPVLIFLSMLVIDWRLALVMIAGIPFMYLVKVLSSKVMERNFQIYFRQEMKMREDMMEYVKNIPVIKAFSKEEVVSERSLRSAREYVYWVKKSMGAVSIPMGIIDIFMEMGVVLVMILGSIFLSRAEITITGFILSIILSAAFTASIGKVATLQHFMIVFREAVKSIAKVLCVFVPDKKEGGLSFGDIEFKGVHFGYGEGKFGVRDVNLRFKERSINAIVGESGCGKSTLSNLLMGFWDVDQGEVTISGEDIKGYSQESISALIGSVQQEVILFDLSIFENIAIGKEGATREEVILAAKKARCHEFIKNLPDLYDTRVGEMGVRLSGGQKQRISIARMILKDAPILVLDEAMAALDSENERLIGEAIAELSKGKTVITIAHHLNTIRQSDQIIVMGKGCVLGIGRHNELMQWCDSYREMVSAQCKVDQWHLKEEIV